MIEAVPTSNDDDGVLDSLKEFPGIIKQISRSEHPVRPLKIKPLNGFTVVSPPSSMLPFWNRDPSTAGGLVGSDVEEESSSMTLAAAIPRFNSDTFWDGLLSAFQLSLGVDFGESLSLSLGNGEKGMMDIGLSYFYFILVILLGNWVLFNCFIATMIVSFRRESILEEEKQSRRLGAKAAIEAAKFKAQHALLLNTERFNKRIADGCRWQISTGGHVDD